jgi:peptide/nickel transport system permease protein
MVLPWRYLAKRVLFLAVTLVIATYLTILIANAGGLIDEILRAQIKYDITTNLARDPGWGQLPEADKTRIIAERLQSALAAKGLDTPFFQRTLIYLQDALTLQLGRALFISSAAGSKNIADIILERLPQTVLLFTTGTLLYSIIGLVVGLRMARRPGGIFDRTLSFIAVVTQTIPPWFFGLFFLLAFAYHMKLFPFGGMVSIPPPTEPIAYLLDVLYHMFLPLMAWLASFFGGWAYVTRNLTMQISEEDFVVAARAKGLPDGLITRRYILRPALPPIITTVALALIGSWTGAIITETVFNWPGLGQLFYNAITVLDAPVIIGLTVVYAYLLVATVFVLDLTYGLMDPRIRTSGG